MASCLHKHLELREDRLYGCIVCGRLFVAEPAQVDVTPEPADIHVAPEPADVNVDPEPADRLGPEALPAVEEPEVDVSGQIRVYLAGKPREVPASARRRKAKPR